MIILKLKIINCRFIVLVGLLQLFGNVDAKGGGRGGGRGGSRGKGMHRGGGGSNSFYTYDPESAPYGKTFGSNGPPINSYIFRNEFSDGSSKGFLISSLFNKAQNTDPRVARWNEEKDKEWRASTRAPYFENNIPGEFKTFPASAVIGAATAFGLVSLFPLNVPKGKPLMYCEDANLIQSPIRIDNKDTYVCSHKTTFKFSCNPEYQNDSDNECKIEEVQCDLEDGINRKIYCSHGTLFSTTSLVCSSTTDIYSKNSNKTTIIECFEGELPKSHSSFIPTTTEFSLFTTTTTPKPLSFSANVHVFLLNIIGKSDVLETTTPKPYPSDDSYAWTAEALTIPPETTTTTKRSTTKRPYVWMEKIYTYHDNGTVETTYKPLSSYLQDDSEPYFPIINWERVYTTEPYVETTTQTTEIPYLLMRKIVDYGSERLVLVPKSEVEVAAKFNYVSKDWIKIRVD